MATAPQGDNDDTTPDARGKLMREVAEQMDAIESDFGDDFEIGRVITIVEVKRPDGDVELRLRANMLPWVTLGMLNTAIDTVKGRGTPS